eukprot:ANDGO_06257.mRNA.1 hypothetical protein
MSDSIDSLISKAEAAVRIQKVWRGYWVRRERSYHQDRSRLSEYAQHTSLQAEEAAIRIQSAFRGTKDRERLRNEMNSNAVRSPSQKLRIPQKDRKSGVFMITKADGTVVGAVVRIQSFFRMVHAKVYVRELKFWKMQNDSAVKIQKVFRGACTRKKVQSRKQNYSSEKQAVTRQSLIEKFKVLSERKELLQNTNLALHRKLAEYFAAKKSDSAGSAEITSTNAAVSGDLEARYMRYLSQFRELHGEHERLQGEYSSLSEDMTARLEDRKAKCSEFQDSFVAFRTEIFKAAENSRTGKPLPNSVIQGFEESLVLKEDEVSRSRLKNITYRNRLHSLESSLKQKEELAEGLHLIDFEQLKIENQTLNEKIEERNEELSKLQRKTTTTVHILTHVKEKLTFVQGDNQKLKRELADLEDQVTRVRDVLTRAKHDRDEVKVTNTKLREAMPLVGNDSLLLDFESRKERAAGLRTQINGLKEQYEQIKMEATLTTQQYRNAEQSLSRTQLARASMTGVPFVR